MAAPNKDFKGWHEFVQKYESASKSEEKIRICEERVQTWLNVLEETVSPIPEMDIPFAIAAMLTIVQGFKRSSPEMTEVGECMARVSKCEIQSGQFAASTEAAAKEIVNIFRNQK